MGFWKIRSVTLGLVWNWPLESYVVHSPQPSIRGGAAGLNTSGPFIGCFPVIRRW